MKLNYGEDKIKLYEINCIIYNYLKEDLTIQNDIHIIEKN